MNVIKRCKNLGHAVVRRSLLVRETEARKTVSRG